MSDADATDIADARTPLAAASAELTAFLEGSEAVFLETGTRLSELSRRARLVVDVSRRAASAGPAAASKEDCASRLEEELGRLEGWLRARVDGSRRELTALSRVLVETEAVVASGSELEETARTLRVLGTNTRIESARNPRGDAGMESVAADVCRLADVVGDRFRTVVMQARGLVQLAERVWRATAELARARGGQRPAREVERPAAELARARGGPDSARTIEDARRVLDALRELGARRAVVAFQAVSTSEEVVRSVDAVIVAMQAHDATRQILEHAREELDAVADAPVLGVAEAARRCELAAAQVEGGRRRLVESLGSMASSLSNVSTRVAALAKQAVALEDGRGEESLGDELARGVARSTEALKQHVQHERATVAATAAVAAAVETMERSLDGIRQLGADVKLIALNALVQTGRAGDAGRVVAVLARGMGGLAVEVGERAAAISRSLGETARAGADLRAGMAGGAVEAGEALAAGLEDLLRRFRSSRETLGAALGEVHGGSGALKDECDAAAYGLAHAAAGTRSLARVADNLKRLAMELDARAPRCLPGTARAGGEERYTMESEREIHRLVLDGESPRRPAPAAAGAAAPQDGGDSLGENVELF